MARRRTKNRKTQIHRQISSNTKKYLQQILLVFVGGLLGFGSSLVISRSQEGAQQKRFLLDKQINAVREYSVAFNQTGSELLGRARGIISQLKTWEMANVDDVPEEDLLKIKKEAEGMLVQASNWIGSATAQRSMISAVFGNEQPEEALSSPFADEEFMNTQQQAYQRILAAKTDQEMIRELDKVFAKLEQGLIDTINQENGGITILIKKLQQQ